MTATALDAEMTRRLIDTAASLVSEDNENPEYDRALVEMTALLLGQSPTDDGASIAHLIGADPAYWEKP